MAQNRSNYYTNPAFCQQSELYRGTSPQQIQTNLQRSSSMREAPIGANASSPQKLERHRHYQSHRYEVIEMDENEIELNNKIIHELQMDEMNQSKNRTQPPPIFQRNTSIRSPQVTNNTTQEHIHQPSPRVHRYAVIPTDDEDDLPHIREMSPDRVRYTPAQISPTKRRYALPPTSQVQSETYMFQPEDIRNSQNPRRPEPVDHNGNSPSKPTNRCTPIPAPRSFIPSNPNHNLTSPTTPKKYNPIATQKLHELLTTPRKPPQRSNSMLSPNRCPPVMSSTPKRAKSPPPNYPSRTPIQHPRHIQYHPQNLPPHRYPPTPTYPPLPHTGTVTSPKAQQKLNYTLPHKYNVAVNPLEVRNTPNTAVIAPIYSRSPPQSVYSETTFSGKSSSWMNLSAQLKDNSNATLAVAALMMILCGALTSGLCFYMISLIGRKYYLDFGLISGFTCFVLGLLGFRTRTCRWLPNRNYISGYIVLSVFSLLTCAGLLVLLALRPKPGSPLADVTSGAVCGISALTLLLASLGVLTSYCCKYPPPDNRVEHCAPGFTV